LLGGAVYVNSFTLIAREVDGSLQEFALAATSVGESIGTLVADISGVFIQGCMFRVNGLAGADFACGA
jgi:CLN3 protein